MSEDRDAASAQEVRKEHPVRTWFRAHLLAHKKRRIFTIVVIALLAYPVLGTLALWTGFVEWAIEDEDIRLEIDNPAYTIWPGRVHMKRVKVYMNGDTQFILEGHDLLTNISMLELLSHKVHVTKLAAHHVRYQMRVHVENPTASKRRLAAYPPLKGLPGTNTVETKAAEKTEKTAEQSYTVIVEGLDISVQELWFFEYRYLGEGKLKGGFTVGPQVMQVSTAVQDIGPGELRFGADETIARRLRGQISCNIPRINPEEHADASFMELVSARAKLRADVVSLANVGAYTSDITVTKGAGPLVFDLFMEKGFLGPKSMLTFETEAVGVKGNSFGVATDFKVAFDAAKEKGLPLGRLDAKSTYVSFAEADTEFTIQIHGHYEEAVLDTIRLGGATDLKRARISMPNIVSNDVDDLGALFGKTSPLKTKAGEAKASVHLDMDGDYWLRGPITAEILRLDLNAAGVRLSGNTWLKTQARFNPKLNTNMLEDVTVRMRNVAMHAGDEAVSDWWMDLSSKRLTLWNGKTPRAEGSVSIRTKNLEPALEALAEKDVISDLIPFFVSLDDFRAKATFRKEGPVTDVTVESESDVWDASGRVYTSDKQNLMALVVGGQAVSLGIAKLQDDELQIRPFAKTDWLNERLAKFPKPLKMAPSKP